MMYEDKLKIWHVARKLKVFTFDDIAIIAEVDEKTVKTYLEELIATRYINKTPTGFVMINDKNLFPPINEDETFNQAPDWAKKQAQKYLDVINASRGLKGRKLIKFIENWNKKNPDRKTSYQSLQRAKKTLYTKGKCALLSKYGKAKGKTTVKDEHFLMFQELYLSVLKPSVKECVEEVKEYFGIGKDDPFPSPISFLRRLKNEIPQEQIDYARN